MNVLVPFTHSKCFVSRLCQRRLKSWYEYTANEKKKRVAKSMMPSRITSLLTEIVFLSFKGI